MIGKVHRFSFTLMGLAVMAFMLQASVLAQPMRLSPEERAEELKKQLSLTDEQTVQVKTILEEQHAAMQKIFESTDRQGMREAMRSLAEETDARIIPLLTEEQKELYIELQKKRRERPGRGRW